MEGSRHFSLAAQICTLCDKGKPAVMCAFTDDPETGATTRIYACQECNARMEADAPERTARKLKTAADLKAAKKAEAKASGKRQDAEIRLLMERVAHLEAQAAEPGPDESEAAPEKPRGK